MGSAELVLYGGLFLAFVSVYSFVMALVGGNADKQSLSWASGEEPSTSKSGLINKSRPLVHNFTLQHAVKIKSPRYRKQITQLLMTAGLERELNVDEFIGLQILWGFMFPLILVLLNFALGMGLPWVIILSFIPLGIIAPRYYAAGEKKRRMKSARRDLPFYADILALSTEAGLDFIGAIQRIVDKAPPDGVLAGEFAQVLKEIKLGSSRVDALNGMKKRLDTSEITSFVAVLVDADSTGASISQVLKDQSNQIRLERFVRAEKEGARASQALLVPMVLFIVPAVFMVVFGPVIIQMISGK